MKNIIVLIIVLSLLSCKEEKKTLPIIGQVEIVDGDTIYHSIPDFKFVNQDSIYIDNASLSEYIYVSDFFFTSCPTICPKVKKQMLRIYDKFENEDKLKLVSHTIDPVRDNVETLKLYSSNLDVSSEKWFFLTGDKNKLLDMADDYFVVAYEDDEVAGGFDHSGKILLVDQNRHIRAFCEGTDPDDVTEFLKDIQHLLDEVKPVVN